MDTSWKSYEEVATYLLNKFAQEFNLSRVESKQSMLGKRSGTDWEVDAKGFLKDNQGFVIVEYRRYTKSRQKQSAIGSLAYSILDTGAQGGIIVSPLGIQSGAQLIAEAEKIVSILLHKNSTPNEFAMQFLNKIFIGKEERMNLIDACDAKVVRICDKCKNSFYLKNDEWTCVTCSIG